MRLAVKVKEKIARTIAEHFTTNEIVNVFNDVNVPTDQSLYAKWRITLDAFSKITTDECFFQILEQFCHPLNFEETNKRIDFIQTIEEILSFEKVEMEYDHRNVKFIVNNKGQRTPIVFEPIQEKEKTSTDYIVEAINYFKDEYNKVKFKGMTYEYKLGYNFAQSNFEPDPDEINYAYVRGKAIKVLAEIGFITEYQIDERVVDDYGNVCDYAICKIDESKFTEQKEASPITEEGVKNVTESVIHHQHNIHFDNSMQEKEIKLAHKIIEEDILVKNKKKISLPKFSSTDWGKIEIRFISKYDVYITAGKKTATANYEGLGFCNDKNGKPNSAWNFLFGLAINNGETKEISSPVPDNIKTQKKVISDRLKTIFKNDTDPFYDFSEYNKYKIKIKLLPPTDEKVDDLGVDDFLKETMTSDYTREPQD